MAPSSFGAEAFSPNYFSKQKTKYPLDNTLDNEEAGYIISDMLETTVGLGRAESPPGSVEPLRQAGPSGRERRHREPLHRRELLEPLQSRLQPEPIRLYLQHDCQGLLSPDLPLLRGTAGRHRRVR